jgi:hypothetical protein
VHDVRHEIVHNGRWTGIDRWDIGCALHPDAGVTVFPEGCYEWPNRTVGIDNDDVGLWPRRVGLG